MTNSVSISNGRNSNMRQCFTRLLGHQETYLIDVQILLFHLLFENFLDLIGTEPRTKRYYVMMSLTDVLKRRISNVQLCFT